MGHDLDEIELLGVGEMGDFPSLRRRIMRSALIGNLPDRPQARVFDAAALIGQHGSFSKIRGILHLFEKEISDIGARDCTASPILRVVEHLIPAGVG